MVTNSFTPPLFRAGNIILDQETSKTGGIDRGDRSIRRFAGCQQGDILTPRETPEAMRLVQVSLKNLSLRQKKGQAPQMAPPGCWPNSVPLFGPCTVSAEAHFSDRVLSLISVGSVP